MLKNIDVYVYNKDLNLMASGTTEFMEKFTNTFLEAGYIVSWVKLDEPLDIDEVLMSKVIVPWWNSIPMFPVHHDIEQNGDCPLCELGHKPTEVKVPKCQN